MELNTLRYFLAVAKEENMTSAAGSLHISQPALSYQIARLEEETGKTLFIRTNRRMTLTEEGMFLKSRAEEIISLCDETLKDMQNESEDIYGDIYIGAAESRSLTLLAEVIQEIRDSYPHIVFHFYSGNYDDVYARMNHGSIDFAVMIEPFDFQNIEKIYFPVKDRIGLYIYREHPLAQKNTVTSEDLKNLPLLLTVRSYMSLEHYAEEFNIPLEELNVAATGNLIYNLALLAEQKTGAILSLEGLVHTDENSPLVFIPYEPAIERRIVFAWKQYRPLSRACEVFLEAFRRKTGSSEH